MPKILFNKPVTITLFAAVNDTNKDKKCHKKSMI